MASPETLAARALLYKAARVAGAWVFLAIDVGFHVIVTVALFVGATLKWAHRTAREFLDAE